MTRSPSSRKLSAFSIRMATVGLPLSYDIVSSRLVIEVLKLFKYEFEFVFVV